VSLWWKANDVPHCRLLSSVKDKWWLVAATLCWRWSCCLADTAMALNAHVKSLNCLYDQFPISRHSEVLWLCSWSAFRSCISSCSCPSYMHASRCWATSQLGRLSFPGSVSWWTALAGKAKAWFILFADKHVHGRAGTTVRPLQCVPYVSASEVVLYRVRTFTLTKHCCCPQILWGKSAVTVFLWRFLFSKILVSFLTAVTFPDISRSVLHERIIP